MSNSSPVTQVPPKTYNFEELAPVRSANRLGILLVTEEESRKAGTAAELAFYAVNDTQALMGFDHAMYFRVDRRQRFHLEAATSLPSIERNAPFTQWIENLLNARPAMNQSCIFMFDRRLRGGEEYPHRHALWLPLFDRKKQVFAGILFARREPWEDADRLIGERLAGTIAHAQWALTPQGLLRRFSMPRWLLWAVPLGLAVLAFFPVSLTTLAPFEVVADQPEVVAAPFDGVIAQVAADPNATVAAGELLFSFEATEFKARADIALQRELVAEAKLATSRQGSFSDPKAKRDIAVLEKELELAKAERKYADELLGRVNVLASGGGLLIYSSRNDLIGRPVATGERVMEIADPARVVYRVDLPVHDSIAIKSGAEVRIFLDSDPLNARSSKVRDAAYRATEQPGGGMAYRIVAIPDTQGKPPRIGLRGTARIQGDPVSLGFFLLRRPISAARQYLGW